MHASKLKLPHQCAVHTAENTNCTGSSTQPLADRDWMANQLFCHSRDDLVALLVEALRNPDYSGVYNGTAPNPVRMSELCSSLGAALQHLLPHLSTYAAAARLLVLWCKGCCSQDSGQCSRGYKAAWRLHAVAQLAAQLHLRQQADKRQLLILSKS